MNTKTHWEHIYETKAPTQVSWYQEHAQFSLQYIKNTGIRQTDPIIDVGGGASTLVDDLIAADFQHITVLDVSATALLLARQRLGARAVHVNWIEADITQADLPEQTYDVWDDRAVFHFLTRPADRQRYVDAVRHAVRRGGHVIVQHLLPMDRIVAVGWKLCATTRKACTANLAMALTWWTVQTKYITRLLERSKSSFTVIAADIRSMWMKEAMS